MKMPATPLFSSSALFPLLEHENRRSSRKQSASPVIPAKVGTHGPDSRASPLPHRPNDPTRHSGESRNPELPPLTPIP